uniref:Uncharacterized protein n=1 Tax=Oryza brachyantha TaxID=4533 RepID=J3LHW3_ORYBR
GGRCCKPCNGPRILQRHHEQQGHICRHWHYGICMYHLIITIFLYACTQITG